jgi:hypothetical protein
MAKCRRLKSRPLVAIDFLEWTPDRRLRHAFVALRADKPASHNMRGLRKSQLPGISFLQSSSELFLFVFDLLGGLIDVLIGSSCLQPFHPQPVLGTQLKIAALPRSSDVCPLIFLPFNFPWS